MDDDAVAEYVKDARSTIEAAPQMDEANTKAAVLQDFLALLDWEIPTNTQLEYSVKAFGRTYKVDYALVLEGTPVAETVGQYNVLAGQVWVLVPLALLTAPLLFGDVFSG